MYKKDLEEYDLEKETKKFIDKIKDYQNEFSGKDIETLKRYKSILKPKNILEYFHAIFLGSDDRPSKLCALEKVLEEKIKQK
ncbi:hypothetical protein KAJ87_04455 [Candidatus Pacearchaeota archaeon]|nr:hypothetical protein [Candidatus Pacearchaeota archaeon]